MEKIRHLVRRMSSWPFVGAMIRWGVLIIKIPRLWAQLMDLSRRQQVFEGEILPRLLEQLSDLNQKLVTSGRHDLDQFVVSLPVALRATARDVAELRQLIGQNGTAFQKAISATDRQADKHVAKIEPKILNVARVDAARLKGPKLWFGNSEGVDSSYLRVDTQALPGVDIVADFSDVPFSDAQVSEICLHHWLQLYTQRDLRNQIFPRVSQLLKADGVFRAEVTDARASVKAFLTGELTDDQLIQILNAGQPLKESGHPEYKSLLCTESLVSLLSEVGLRDIRVTNLSSVAEDGYRLEITARK
jgi:hypothetical protein